MSRSKHTVPPRIRAPRRVRAPREPRSSGDPSARQALTRALKEWGIRLDGCPEPALGEAAAPLPRVRAARPRVGFHHPADRADVLRVLRFLGEPCTYGLQCVALVRGDEATEGRRLQLGRLLVPGRIVIYEQPLPPWVLAGRLPDQAEERLRFAGAQIGAEEVQTVVAWPGETLRDFMLFDVLMHEVGHHLIQQYKGKRPARVVRTRDHEAFADQFARHCRLIFAESSDLP